MRTVELFAGPLDGTQHELQDPCPELGAEPGMLGEPDTIGIPDSDGELAWYKRADDGRYHHTGKRGSP